MRRIVSKAGEIKATFKYMNKGVTPFLMKALEHLMPVSGQKSTIPTNLTTHTAHQHWLAKIHKLWTKLNKLRNPEVVAI